jgi:hypothetical protein
MSELTLKELASGNPLPTLSEFRSLSLIFDPGLKQPWAETCEPLRGKSNDS